MFFLFVCFVLKQSEWEITVNILHKIWNKHIYTFKSVSGEMFILAYKMHKKYVLSTSSADFVKKWIKK